MDDAAASFRAELDSLPPYEPPNDDGDRTASPQQQCPFDIIRRGNVAVWINHPPEPPPFIIADFAEQGAVALLAGEAGAGKSYSSLSAALSVATGTRFYGKYAARGRAVCLFAEDSTNAIHARLSRLCLANNVDMSALVDRLYPISLLDDPPESRILWRDKAPTPRLAALEAELAAIPDLKLLVIDCVAQVFAGNEIDRLDVAGFLFALTSMARRLKIGIILIHHASKSQDGSSLRMASGSTAWIAQCRAAAELRKATENDGPRFAVRKINNGREWEIELKWTEDGALVPAVEISGAVASIERRGHEKTFLECLAAVTAQGRTVSEGRTSPRYAPKVFARMPEAGSAKLRDLERAMEALFSSCSIRVGEAGRGADRHAVTGILATQDVEASE